MKMFSLKDEIAFVTGAGSGIGQGIAIGLAEAGADVALFDLGPGQGLDATAKTIAERGRRSVRIAGDVSDAEALASAVKTAEETLGALTLAVNCAGIANARPAEEMPLDQWRRMIDVESHRRLPILPGGGTRHVATRARRNRQHRLDVRHDRQSRPDAGALQCLEGWRDPPLQEVSRWNGSGAASASMSSVQATR